jgi:hypothetical protein
MGAEKKKCSSCGNKKPKLLYALKSLSPKEKPNKLSVSCNNVDRKFDI